MKLFTKRSLLQLLIALLLGNTIAIFGMQTESLRSFFTSVVNFAITILPPDGTELAPPRNTRPRDTISMSLPYLFSTTTPENEFLSTRWLFRDEAGSYEAPIAVFESDAGVRNIMLQKKQIKNAGRYFWKTQRFIEDGTESVFSPETSFVIKGKVTLNSFKKADKKTTAKAATLTPLKLKLKTSRIQKGQPLDISIKETNTSFLPSNKKVTISLEIASANGETKVLKEEVFDASAPIVEKTLDSVRTLPAGDYVLVLNLDDDGTQFAQASAFTIEESARPSAGDSGMQLLVRLEILFGVLVALASAYAILLTRPVYHKKRDRHPRA